MRSLVGLIALGFALGACGNGSDTSSTTSGWNKDKNDDRNRGSAAIVESTIRTDIVSNQPGAQQLDPKLVNAWGLSFGDNGNAWVSAAGSGTSQIYDRLGRQPLPPVSIPGPQGSSEQTEPTGQVANTNASLFMGDRFIFVTEQGTIAGWQPDFGAQARLRYDKSTFGRHYTGVTIVKDCSGVSRLYAANFAGSIDVFDAEYNLLSIDKFQDANLPQGFAPFNVEELEGMIVVAYAKRDPQSGDEMSGAGLGYIDLFDTDGMLLARLASAGNLDAPWGIAMSRQPFGAIRARSLFVGNFGDGHINVYELSGTGGRMQARPLGMLGDARGNAIAIEGLWALKFGNTTDVSGASTLYFTAGPNDEKDGLFGRLDIAVQR